MAFTPHTQTANRAQSTQAHKNAETRVLEPPAVCATLHTLAHTQHTHKKPRT